MPKLTPAERFARHTMKTPTCWLWTASKNHAGYGYFQDGTGPMRTVRAHRWAYEHAHGPIPTGMQIDHICHNRACVNPAHLRLVTNKQNMQNLSGAHQDSKSGVRGVYWEPSRQKWRAQVKHNDKIVHVGRFDTLREAEAAAIAKRNEVYTHNVRDRSQS